MRSVVLIAFAFIALATTRPVLGQPSPRVLAGSGLCPRCSLEPRLVATLGSPQDHALITDGLWIVGAGPDGTFLVPGYLSAGLLMYNSTGKFLRVVGRMGQGPNEFTGAGSTKVFSAPGDSTYIFSSPRIFVYDPNMVEARRVTLGRSVNNLAVVDGSIISLRGMRGDSAVMVSVLSPAGDAAASFVTRPRTGRVDPCLTCTYASMASANGPGEFWIIYSGQYRLERWNLSGRQLETLQVSGAPWRDRWLSEMRNGWGAMTFPAVPVLGVSQRSDGLLLVTAQGPAAAPLTNSTARLPRARSYTSWAMGEELGMDQIFEIVDPSRGVLATARVPNKGFHLMEGGRFATRVIEDADGIIQVQIWELVFSRN